MTEFWETRHRNWLDQYISFKISYFYMYPMKSLSWEENETLIKESEWRVKNRVNALNPRSVLNTGYRWPSLCSEANGPKAAHQYVLGPKAAKRPIILLRGLFPVCIHFRNLEHLLYQNGCVNLRGIFKY